MVMESKKDDSKNEAKRLVKKNRGKCPCCGITPKRFYYLKGFVNILPPVCRWCYGNCGGGKHTPRKLEKDRLKPDITNEHENAIKVLAETVRKYARGRGFYSKKVDAELEEIIKTGRYSKW